MKSEHILIGRCISCNDFVFSDDFDNEQVLEKFGEGGLCLACQKGIKFGVNYFINKFENILDDKWTISTYKDKEDRCCALGHCGEFNSKLPTKESIALDKIFQKSCGLRVSLVNDGECPKYLQKSPRQRILAALYDIKEELKDES